MFVNGMKNFEEEWHEGFDLRVFTKSGQCFVYTFTTEEEVNAAKIVLDKLIVNGTVKTVENVIVGEVYY